MECKTDANTALNVAGSPLETNASRSFLVLGDSLDVGGWLLEVSDRRVFLTQIAPALVRLHLRLEPGAVAVQSLRIECQAPNIGKLVGERFAIDSLEILHHHGH